MGVIGRGANTPEKSFRNARAATARDLQCRTWRGMAELLA